MDEEHIIKYFDRIVVRFRDIQERGYCVVDGERHVVFIGVIVVVDISYLHKYLRRGGGSHSCTNCCFLCSMNRKYRQEGYHRECLECRRKGEGYNDLTGCQQCRHHDVCDREFLEWENTRMRYLEKNVKPCIPATNKPYYESLESLREERLKKCATERKRNQFLKIKSYAVMEKWLLQEGRTRVGCDLGAGRPSPTWRAARGDDRNCTATYA